MRKLNDVCSKCPVHINGGKCRNCFATAESPFEIVQYYEWGGSPVINRASDGYGIALDIGTTTLAFELFDLTDGARRATFSAVNSQRAFGADVISRISRATLGAANALHTYIKEDIRRGVMHILSHTDVSADVVRRMVIAGNTTMLHLLFDLPCHTLGVYPFTPVVISGQTTRFEFLPNCEVLSLPGISTFVGADIVAGIYCLGGVDKNKTFLLIDLGTNGEMALVHRGKVWVASTAAGPAFEAGNISKGVPSVEGAITSAQFEQKLNGFTYTTINDAPPIGICGTGVVDITAELVRHKRVDEAGRLDDVYPDKAIEIAPNIAFTQKDIREVQLAKSAVRAGMEILLESAGCITNEINHVYLAGGFGYRLNPRSAEALGLFPPGLADKVRAVGNTALGGAAKSLVSKSSTLETEAIAALATEVSLSAHPRFNDLFMEYMLFPEGGRC
jgi:uncharacterized 2Fe-2S/4Fe-4S cluster protein (DUF4445 family)